MSAPYLVNVPQTSGTIQLSAGGSVIATYTVTAGVCGGIASINDVRAILNSVAGSTVTDPNTLADLGQTPGSPTVILTRAQGDALYQGKLTGSATSAWTASENVSPGSTVRGLPDGSTGIRLSTAPAACRSTFDATESSYWLRTSLSPTSRQIDWGYNFTGTATPLGTARVDIPGLLLTVPPQGSATVWLALGAQVQQLVAGPGVVFLTLVETTGAATDVTSLVIPLANVDNTKNASYLPNAALEVPIGTVSSQRTFKVQGSVGRDGGAATAQVLNGATTPSWATAFTR